MSKDTAAQFRVPGAIDDALKELLRAVRGSLIQQAVETELEELLAENAHCRDGQGRAAVGRTTRLNDGIVHTQVKKSTQYGYSTLHIKLPVDKFGCRRREQN